MTLKDFLKTTEKFVIDNSPGILTGLGVAGAVTTALLTGRAAYRVGMDASTQYHEAVKEDESLPAQLLEPKHIVKTYWREFIPAATVGATTISAIIMANQIGSRRAAAVAAAFKISEDLAKEYRDKVVETLGEKKEQALADELNEERIARTPGSENVIIVGSEAVFFDTFSGRYFKAEMENVKKAVNEVNYQVNNNFYACLTDFYDKLGLPKTAVSDEFGWNTDRLLDIRFTALLMEDGRPAIAIEYNKYPIRDYNRLS